MQHLGTFKGHFDLSRIGARRHDEVVLHLAVVAVVHEIDAAVDVPKMNFSKPWDACQPFPRIIAKVVVIADRERIGAESFSRRLTVDQRHAHVRAQLVAGFLQAECRVLIGNQQPVSGTRRGKTHARRFLPQVGLEA